LPAMSMTRDEAEALRFLRRHSPHPQSPSAGGVLTRTVFS